jgi:hypothetical protein
LRELTEKGLEVSFGGLDHAHSAWFEENFAMPDTELEPNRHPPPIEESDVERKPHAKGVHAATARNVESTALRRPPPESKPDKPSPGRVRNENDHAELSATAG